MQSEYKNYLDNERKLIEQAIAKELTKLPEAAKPLTEYVISSGGKRLRPLLLVLVAKVFQAKNQDIYNLSASVEFLHSASLMHDDVIDESGLRRGVPTSHKKFGINKTILAGDILLSASSDIVLRFKSLEMIEILTKACKKTALGEIEEMYNLRNPDLSYEDYLQIIAHKTAWVISGSCELGALVAKASAEERLACKNFGFNLGMAFQLVDDALDILPESKTGKPAGGDLREGKLTPPIRFYLKQLNSAEQVEFTNKFRLGDFTTTEVDKIIKSMRKLKCAEQTRELADKYIDDAKKYLSCLPVCAEREMLMAIVENVKTRDH